MTRPHDPAVSRSEVEEFLAATRFSGYQAMPLPYGLSVPGIDRGGRAASVLDLDLAGRSVLDVGTNYGAIPCAAMARGAAKAVGLEPSAEHFAVARRIAELNGNRWEVRQQRAEELAGETFDVVTLLNVLHHVTDPVEVMRRVVDVCRETLVVEFCLPDDPEYLVHLRDRSPRPSRLSRARARARSATVRAVTSRLPLMAVGDWPYHRTFYFSPRAFDHLFRLHLGFFESIRFAPGTPGKRRALAFCRVAQRTQARVQQ